MDEKCREAFIAAGYGPSNDLMWKVWRQSWVTAIALTEMAIIDEREDCAQICNDLMTEDGEKCARLIRKRGE